MSSFIDTYPDHVRPMVQRLLGCAWGRSVHTADDMEPCREQAIQIVVLHNGPNSKFDVRLCARHVERIQQETSPHQVNS